MLANRVGSLTTIQRSLTRWAAAIGAAMSLAAMPAHAAAPKLDWRVENPFRFFTDPADTEVHRATYKALTAQQRMNPVLSSEIALQERHDLGWAATMYRKTCVDQKTHAYTCGAYLDYINPTAHPILANVADLEDAKLLTCTWLTVPLGPGAARGEAVTQACNEPVRLVIPYPKGATVTVEIGGRPIINANIAVRDILVVGMGDSFASGEGNPDIPVRFSRDRTADYGTIGSDGKYAGYPARVGEWRSIGDRAFIGENARWIDQACHRSLYSHQLRAALQLAVEDPHRSVTYVGLACSGAEIIDGMFLRYKGNEWVPNPPTLSQLSAAAVAQCGKNEAPSQDFPEAYHLKGNVPELKGGLELRRCPAEQSRAIDLVFLSIGGNDIGFSRLVANAVLSSGSTLRLLGGWLGEVHGQAEAESAMTRLDMRYRALDRALHNILHIPWAQSDRIILASYPGMALIGDGSEICDDGKAGLEVVPDFELSKTKMRESTWIADKLHRHMREVAERSGWSLAEMHRRRFIERGICSGGTHDGGNPADDLRLPRKIDGVWVPYNPADYKAYATRQRWFRTPNDAFMTGNFHVAASVVERILKLHGLSWFQLLLASTYSGAFHPTAEGHAAIADAVADKARIVLNKYGQGPIVDNRPAERFEPPPPVDEPGVAMPDVAGVTPAPGTEPSLDAAREAPALPVVDDSYKPGQPNAPARAVTPPRSSPPPPSTQAGPADDSYKPPPAASPTLTPGPAAPAAPGFEQGPVIDPRAAGLPANTPFIVRPDDGTGSASTSGSDTYRPPQAATQAQEQPQQKVWRQHQGAGSVTSEGLPDVGQ